VFRSLLEACELSGEPPRTSYDSSVFVSGTSHSNPHISINSQNALTTQHINQGTHNKITLDQLFQQEQKKRRWI